jgi:transcription initiation factor TFIIIB Brf1 subunit/transcription initiation factor TFIIB
MENIKCPYCDMTVRVADIEAEDGACPECGAPLMGVLLHQDGAEDVEDELDAFAEHEATIEDDDPPIRRGRAAAKDDDDDDDEDEEDD